jgi:RNA recognition motif-containing protein
MEEDKIRLFVGGLAAEVTAGDLQERFAPLGNVQNITIPAAKVAGFDHRGFAYVDFVPKTDASLRKLFSAVGDRNSVLNCLS